MNLTEAASQMCTSPFKRLVGDPQRQQEYRYHSQAGPLCGRSTQKWLAQD